tara:strand:- start:3068 stop:3463 length:396 start_codon:yes stop_codon:yes gene_type:complete
MPDPVCFNEDGETPSSLSDLELHRDFLVQQSCLDATVPLVLAHIADNEKLAAVGLVVEPDEVNANWVIITFPTDEGVPLFWALAAANMVRQEAKYLDGAAPNYGEVTTTPYQVRQDKTFICNHLDDIAQAL